MAFFFETTAIRSMKMNKEEIMLKKLIVYTLYKGVIKSHCNVILGSICHTANMLRFLLRVSSVPNGGVSEPAVNKKLFKLSPSKKIIHHMDLENNDFLNSHIGYANLADCSFSS